MNQRIDYQRVGTGAIGAMLGLERYVRESGLEPGLVHLVKLRASQVNGCAYCVDMHWKDAVAGGDSADRLNALCVWRETPFFTDRERAALEWAEALTLISEGGVPEPLFHATREHFSEKEIVDLTLAIVVINGWNRIAISFRPPVGQYQPAAAGAGTAAG